MLVDSARERGLRCEEHSSGRSRAVSTTRIDELDRGDAALEVAALGLERLR